MDVNIAAAKAHIAEARLTQRLAAGLSLTLSGQYSHTDKFYGNVFPSGVVNAGHPHGRAQRL